MTSKLSSSIICKSQTQLTTSRHRDHIEKESVERIDIIRCVDRIGAKGNPLEIIWEFIFDPAM